MPKEYYQFIPHTSTIVWIIFGLIVICKLNYFLEIFREAISEKPTDGTVAKVSLKRIIPIIFTFLICYMVVGCMRNGKTFNETAFWGLLLFISIATTVLTVTQASGFIDKINIFKGKALESKSEEITVHKKTEEVKQVADQT